MNFPASVVWVGFPGHTARLYTTWTCNFKARARGMGFSGPIICFKGVLLGLMEIDSFWKVRFLSEVWTSQGRAQVRLCKKCESAGPRRCVACSQHQIWVDHCMLTQ